MKHTATILLSVFVAATGCGDPQVITVHTADLDEAVSPPLDPPPEGPVKVPEDSILLSQEVGTLPGSVSVTATGNAAYSIPVRVPAGRAGIQPSLAITLNDSNANGMLGVGWSLSGLSQIVPCARTTAQDGAPDAPRFAGDDAFCLDGTRLVAVEGSYGGDGTIYRLERDRLYKIVSHGVHPSGAPQRFVVHRPDGTTWSYSRRLEAKQVEHTAINGDAPTERTVIAAWALEGVKDQSGNSMTFEYLVVPHGGAVGTFGFDDTRALEVYPRAIHYTKHDSGLPARRSVVFEYEPRPDVVDRFRSGVHRSLGKRLRRIVAQAPNPEAIEEVWSYELTYRQSKGSGRSLLDDITLCDAKGACLPPTQLSWQSSYPGYVQRSTDITVDDGAHMTDLTPADFNGDGLTDLLFWEGRREWCDYAGSALEWYPSGAYCNEYQTARVSGEWMIAYSNGSGLGTPEPTGLVGEYYTRLDYVAEQPPGASPSEYNKPTVLDFDGDGAADLFAARSGKIFSPSKGYAVLQDLGSTYEPLPPFWEPDVRYLGDFDGDGRVDLFSNEDRPKPFTSTTPYGTEVTGWYGPYDWSDYHWSYQLGGGAPGFGSRQPSGIAPFMQRFDRNLGYLEVDPVNHSISMDVDGDGRTELALPTPGNAYRTFEVAADGSPELDDLNLPVVWPGVPGASPVSEYVPMYLDINGDGLRDVIASGGVDLGGGRVDLLARLNTGQGFGPWYVAAAAGYRRPPSPWDPDDGQATHDNGVRVFDYNQDGRDDFVVPGEDGEKPLVYVSNGRSFAEVVPDFDLEPPVGMNPPGEPMQYLGYTHRFGDLDGDGAADLFALDDVSHDVVIWQRSNVGPPDTLLNVENGLEGHERIVRRLLRDAKIYRPGTGCSYPQRCLRNGGYVVSMIERSSANGLTEHHAFDYEDGRIDMTGRGFVGFATRNEKFLETGVRTTTSYAVDYREHGAYPLAGLPSLVRTDIPIDAGQSRVVQQKTKYEIRWSFGDQVLLVRPQVGRQAIDDVAGPPPTTIDEDHADRLEIITRTWDEYGNLSSEESVRSGWIEPEGGGARVQHDGTRTFRRVLYDNDETSWILGVRTFDQVSSYAAPPSTAAETRTTRIVPDAQGRPHEVIVEPGDARLYHKTTYHWGGHGELEKIDSENSPLDPEAPYQVRTEGFSYDSEKLYPTGHCNALSQCAKLAVHPAHGVLVMSDDPNGYRVARRYDGFGRRRGLTTREGYETWIDYLPGWAGTYVEQVQRSDGYRRSVEYNRAGAAIYVKQKGYDGSDVTREITYGHDGLVATTTNAFFDSANRRITQYDRDGLGRITRAEGPDGSVVRASYGLDDEWHWDPEGHESYLRFDVDGRVTDSVDVHSEDGALYRTTYGYAPFDLVETVTDPLGNAKVTRYDALGRQVRLDDPDAGKRHFTYDGFGELIMERDPVSNAAGIATTFEHDLLGRVTQVDSIDGTETITWDVPPAGSGAPTWYGARQAVISADGTETRYEVDAYGRLAHERSRIDGKWYELAYGYDGRSRLAKLSYPKALGTPRFYTKMGYFDDGSLSRIDSVTVDGEKLPIWKSTERNADGKAVRELYGDKVETYRGYRLETGRLELAVATNVDSGASLFRYEYAYDDDGNLERKEESVSSFEERYVYDSIDRLVDWRRGPTGDPRYHAWYEYDPAGNLLERHEDGGPKPFAEIFRHDDLVSGQGHVTGYERWAGATKLIDRAMDYDGNGRRKKGTFEEARYTRFDLPKRIAQDGEVTTYLYDGNHQRVARYSPGRELVRVGGLYERRVEGGSVEHVYLVHSDAGPVAQVVEKEGEGKRKMLSLHRDRLGAAGAVSDDSGDLVQGWWHTPFGRPAFGEGRPTYSGDPADIAPGFDGHRADAKLGLVDMRGRVYDPLTTTFLSPDPIVSRPLFGQDQNRYSFALDNPLRYVDPTGLQEVESGGWEDWNNDGRRMQVREGDGVMDFRDEPMPASCCEPFVITADLERGSAGGDDNLDDPGTSDDIEPYVVGRRTERMVLGVRVSYSELLPDGFDADGNQAYRRQTTTERLGEIIVEFTHTRDSAGNRGVHLDRAIGRNTRPSWYVPGLDIQVDVSARVAPGREPEILLEAVVRGPSVSAAGGSGVSEGSGNYQVQAPMGQGLPTISRSGPSTTHSRSSDVRRSGNPAVTAMGRIRISAEPGRGPQLLENPADNESGYIQYVRPGVGGTPPTTGTATVDLVGPDWDVISR